MNPRHYTVEMLTVALRPKGGRQPSVMGAKMMLSKCQRDEVSHAGIVVAVLRVRQDWAHLPRVSHGRRAGK